MSALVEVAGVLSALTSALIWGGADFMGGLASRRTNLFQVLALTGFSGLVVLIACVLITREPLISLNNILWSAVAGASGLIGIAALYQAFSLGHITIVAPTSAMIGAILPVIFSIFTQGIPGTIRLVGFAIALVGIWLVSRSTSDGGKISRGGFLLSCMAGVFFAVFFILIAQVKSETVFMPLMVVRLTSFSMTLLLLWLQRTPLPSLSTNPTALLAGILDAGGNVFYLLATRFARLDVVVVLVSLYPASTVILASLVLKEKASAWQWIGLVWCLLAIVLITI
jgi:drug/metabolite transporter (DMT)-like permease